MYKTQSWKSMKLLSVILLYTIVQTLAWFSVNYQFMSSTAKERALTICIILAIPTSCVGFFAARAGVEYFNSIWSARLIGFGTSYLVFPMLTWTLLGESPFATKTIICIMLSFMIIAVQIFYPK